jgi:hypothetical protein
MAAGLCQAVSAANPLQTLWQIGQPDRQNAEFALAPNRYNQFRQDGFLVIGASSPQADWPYVHPGPQDNWAGSRQHSFGIAFGLKTLPADATGRLVLDLVDSHSSGPPRVRVQINGRSFEKHLPGGAGDASVNGRPSEGRPYQWALQIPNGVLRLGDNEITITTLAGSWFLYDSLRLEAPAGAELGKVNPGTKILSVSTPSVWLKEQDRPVQPIRVDLRHLGDDATVTLKAGETTSQVVLKSGLHSVELKVPARDQAHNVTLSLVTGAQTLASTDLQLTPPRIRDLWLLPHSHVDIGYTHRQEEIIDVQIGNLEKAMRLARASAANPPGQRFKWNPEAVWALDHFLQRATPEKKAAFLQAVRDGEVGVDGLYGNMLTGLCRPEELAQCLEFGARLSNLTGRPVLSASICDVPGYTWGMVPIMAQAGVKYFAIGPNFGDRVGTIHVWDDKPFYWKSQSGRERLLCWVVDNYHHLGNLEENVIAYVRRLEQTQFPYDSSFIFWVGAWPNGGVDNAPPDEQLVEKVLAWNAKYAAPKVTIGLTGEFFEAFERKHGDKLPEYSGDLTPYWEDGAGSTSLETALNRASADRLTQAAALYALRSPQTVPTAQFDQAWKNVLLYSEHTWGAWCSISKPDDSFTVDQWKVKQAFALDADKQSRELLATALPSGPAGGSWIEVFNTAQWPRTDLAVIPVSVANASIMGVAEASGKQVLSQRLSSGELVFLAKDVPPFGARRYRLTTEPCRLAGSAAAEGSTLRTRKLRLEMDPATGAVKSLKLAGLDHDFVDPSAPVGLNEYRYVLGTDSKGAKGNTAAKISVLETGSLVAALRVDSQAPGCNRLRQDIRVIDGLDRVELINEVDRKSVREKDGVHFGFGFQVPEATLRMETPWAVVRPNVDQLPGSCRNWFTVQRWVDISGRDRGIIWAPLDAPLMEIGGLTANLLGSVAFHEWMTNALDSETIYSWAQNNHWHTNYKIDQPGVTTFRYFLRPHKGGYSAMDAARFGQETTRPLLVAPADAGTAVPSSLVKLTSANVLLETVKVSQDGKAYILRLFGVSGRTQSTGLRWGAIQPTSLWLSDLTEKPITKLGGRVEVPAYGVVMLRAEVAGTR